MTKKLYSSKLQENCESKYIPSEIVPTLAVGSVRNAIYSCPVTAYLAVIAGKLRENFIGEIMRLCEKHLEKIQWKKFDKLCGSAKTVE